MDKVMYYRIATFVSLPHKEICVLTHYSSASDAISSGIFRKTVNFQIQDCCLFKVHMTDKRSFFFG